MDLVTVVGGSLLANFMTAVFLYGIHRLNKNERDLGAMAMVLAISGTVVLVGLALA